MAKVELYIAYIVDELRKGNGERGKVLAKFVKKWQTSARTFDRAWRKAQMQYQTLSQAIEQKKDEATTQAALIDVSNGLKSKSQRMDNIQKQIDELNSILESGKTKDAIIDDKTLSYLDIERSLTALEKATLMRTIRDLNAELNKMDGSYAPMKSEVKEIKEQPLFPDNK